MPKHHGQHASKTPVPPTRRPRRFGRLVQVSVEVDALTTFMLLGRRDGPARRLIWEAENRETWGGRKKHLGQLHKICFFLNDLSPPFVWCYHAFHEPVDVPHFRTSAPNLPRLTGRVEPPVRPGRVRSTPTVPRKYSCVATTRAAPDDFVPMKSDLENCSLDRGAGGR